MVDSPTLASLVGNTPLLPLMRISPEGRTILAKCEHLNPGGSVKDRIGFGMVRAALERGDLKVGGTIVEPTAGNTGVSLAIAAVHYGLKMVAVMPDRFSLEKAQLIEALGGTVLRTPSAEGIEGAIALSLEKEEEEGWWCPQQFGNRDNWKTHYETTGPEIWKETHGKIDAFVCGVGSGGTFVGVARFLKEKNPKISSIAVQPEGSVLLGGESAPHKVEGIGVDDLATLGFWDPELADGVETVSDKVAHHMTSRLSKEEGLLVGGSSGALVAAACRIAQRRGRGAQIVTLLPDGGERYLSKGLYGPWDRWVV
ncbi:cysteine synthase family protein [bacterium]|nr:cysteine synthase family protein [bacterium]